MLKLIRKTLVFLFLISCFPGNFTFAQQPAQTNPKSPSTPAEARPEAQSPRRASATTNKKDDEKIIDVEAMEAQRRAFAVSLIMSLADEARSYKSLALQSRITAHAADALWGADSDGA